MDSELSMALQHIYLSSRVYTEFWGGAELAVLAPATEALSNGSLQLLS
jgi:hypothetical protein